MDDVAKNLQQVKEDLERKLAQAQTVQEAENLRREYLGKKGPINQVMNTMKLLSNDDKPKLGLVINEIKTAVETMMTERMETLELEQIERDMISQRVDVTMPGLSHMVDIGRRHPISMVIEKTIDIFTKLGYDTVTDAADSPEVETDYYCFEALNCPKDHPARDMQDTFYLTDALTRVRCKFDNWKSANRPCESCHQDVCIDEMILMPRTVSSFTKWRF